MNKTESGAIAVGDPMSNARILEEAERILEKRDLKLFDKTDEGRYLWREFMESNGFKHLDKWLEEYVGVMRNKENHRRIHANI